MPTKALATNKKIAREEEVDRVGGPVMDVPATDHFKMPSNIN